MKRFYIWKYYKGHKLCGEQNCFAWIDFPYETHNRSCGLLKVVEGSRLEPNHPGEEP